MASTLRPSPPVCTTRYARRLRQPMRRGAVTCRSAADKGFNLLESAPIPQVCHHAGAHNSSCCCSETVLQVYCENTGRRSYCPCRVPRDVGNDHLSAVCLRLSLRWLDSFPLDTGPCCEERKDRMVHHLGEYGEGARSTGQERRVQQVHGNYVELLAHL